MGSDNTKNEGELSVASDLARPGEAGRAVTPSDSADLTHPLKRLATRGIYIGTTGDLKIIHFRDDTAVTYVGVLAGTLFPFRVKKVLATGTTASNIVAVY